MMKHLNEVLADKFCQRLDSELCDDSYGYIVYPRLGVWVVKLMNDTEDGEILVSTEVTTLNQLIGRCYEKEHVLFCTIISILLGIDVLLLIIGYFC